MNQIIYKEKKYNVRENTLDQFIINENSYKNCLFKKSDNWLDIGGNIGAFCIKYADKVNKIVSYEPDEANYNILNDNILLNNIHNVVTFKKAVVGTDCKTVDFYINTKKNNGTHSMYVKNGRIKTTVDAQNINNCISENNINKLKIDCEGAEYEILKNINDYSVIEEIILEFHFNVLKDHPKHLMYSEIYTMLNKYYKTVIGKRPNEINKNWTCILHCYN